MKYIDLHTHSNCSDGTSNPRELVMAMKLRGIDLMALTDHDTIQGYEEAKKEAEKWNIELIAGAEFTSPRYHILGLNLDTENYQLIETLKKSKAIREKVTKNRTKILQDYGMPITLDIVRENFPYVPLGKVHITLAMMLDENCRKLIEKNNGDASALEIMQFYLGKEGIVGKYETKDGLDEEEIISTIHNAGGIAIIAHPAKDIKDMSELDELLAIGLDGLEIQPNHYEMGYEKFEKYAKEHNLLVTYGSDYHGPGFSRQIMGRQKNILTKELEEKLEKVFV